MKACASCGAELQDRISEYGCVHYPVCADCFFEELDYYPNAAFSHEAIINDTGARIGHKTMLTEYGAMYLEAGKAGDVVAVHYYGKPIGVVYQSAGHVS